MTFPPTDDRGALALCIWKEARGVGYRGMTAVACVVKNRSLRHNTSYQAVVYEKWQFSSMSAPGDPQLHLEPQPGDVQWNEAQDIAADVIAGNVADITLGSSLYYDDSISFPSSWNRAKCVATVTIGRLNFFREIG